MAKPGSIRVKLQTGHPLYMDADLGWSKMTGTVGCPARNWRPSGESMVSMKRHTEVRDGAPATKTLERRSSSGAVERSTHLLLHKKRPFMLCAFTSHSTVTPLLETVKWDSSWSTAARSAL